jgi:hypothetical protein
MTRATPSLTGARARRLGAWRRSLAAALLCALPALPAIAAADPKGDADKLGAYESEVRLLGTDLPRPGQVSTEASAKRLVDAQVAFAEGDYDTAATALVELARTLKGGDATIATYYLAESLYQKGERGAARAYYAQLVNDNGSTSKYYQPCLERLIEIAILEKDEVDVDKWRGALSGLSPSQRRPSVPYVLGKYALATNKLDEAIAHLQEVPKDTDFELPALYVMGAVQVAKKDLAKATEIYTDLVGRKPKTSNDRRVIELAQLALGRVYYERDQPAKSIDAYLLVDRRSDLFTDALYEVGWVYVKNKQYDKALRALELLSKSSEQSIRTPTVKLLEGNLRIRKGQALKNAQVTGTEDVAGDPDAEYAKAIDVFTATHDAYYPSWAALAAIVDNHADPTPMIEQLAGRRAQASQVSAAMPEAAAAWLQDEPDIRRAISLERDLGAIELNIEQSQDTIAHLEGVLAATNRSGVYPALNARHIRIGEIEDDLIGLRSRLADEAVALLPPATGDLPVLTSARQAVLTEMASTANPERAYNDHLVAAGESFDKLEESADEVAAQSDENDATAVALRTYAAAIQPAMAADAKAALLKSLDEVGQEDAALQRELTALHREVALGRDLAGAADDTLLKARALRHKMRLAQDAEHKGVAGQATASRDRNRSQELAALGDRATRVAEQLEQVDGQIDKVVDDALAAVKVELATARQAVAADATEFTALEAEAHALGGTALAPSLANVKDKLYDVVIRADVGNVDVGWSEKEDADEDLKRLNLSRAREVKQLKDEFKDILDAHTAKPSEPKKLDKASAPATDADGRISPKGDATGAGPTSPAAPTVKPDPQPDAPKADPKKDAKKAPKGGNKAAGKGGAP